MGTNYKMLEDVVFLMDFDQIMQTIGIFNFLLNKKIIISNTRMQLLSDLE